MNAAAEAIAKLAHEIKSTNPHAAMALLFIASAIYDNSIKDLTTKIEQHAARQRIINVSLVTRNPPTG